MAGFGKVTFVAEHFTNLVVNVFHYRSTEWLPGQGNPFDDVLAFVDAVVAHIKPAWKACHNTDCTLLRAEGVGYDDSYGIVTSSPLVRTIGETGTDVSTDTTGSFVSGNLGLRCGEQVQINGIGHSKRNRGYLSIGPIMEGWVDSYGHIIPAAMAQFNSLGAVVDDPITIVAPAVVLTPVRIHEKWTNVLGLRVLTWRTYSDILGYTVPRMASVRRSRMGEA